MKYVKKLVLIFAVFAVLALSSCGSKMKEPPEITVLHNGTEINHATATKKWNGADYGDSEIFDYIFNYSLSKLSDLDRKNSYRISFKGKIPDSIEIAYEYLDTKGQRLEGFEPGAITPNVFSDTVTFDLEDFLTCELNSVSERDFCVGFKMKCTWEEGISEYAFASKVKANGSSDTEAHTDTVNCDFDSVLCITPYLGSEELEANRYELVASYADLVTYYHENKGYFNFEYENSGFKKAMEKYDDTFFGNNLLIIVMLNEKSSAFETDITSVVKRSGVLAVNITRSGTYAKTGNSERHLIVELSKNAYSGEQINIAVTDNTEGEDVSDTFADVMYLISASDNPEIGYENVFMLDTDGNFVLDMNNYNGFYLIEGTYVIEDGKISMKSEGRECTLEYSEAKSCYILNSEKIWGTMYDGANIFVTDKDTYDNVVQFHKEWNEGIAG